MRGIKKSNVAVAIVLALGLGLTGCGGSSSKPEQVDYIQSGKTVYEAGLQYVKIVDQDVSDKPNEQPVKIAVEDMKVVLESIGVTEETLFSEKQGRLFSSSEVQILSNTLSEALSRAQATDDVTFVTIGTKKGALATERVTNSGRVFMSDGRLNIIFGLIQELYSDKDRYTGQEIDRRVNPLLPGTRKSDSTPAIKVSLDSGQSYYLDPKTGKERTDWLVIDIPTVLAKAKERQAAGQDDLLSPEVREDIARNKQSVKNLSEDVGGMKEILFDMSEKLDSLQKQLDELNATKRQ